MFFRCFLPPFSTQNFDVVVKVLANTDITEMGLLLETSVSLLVVCKYEILASFHGFGRYPEHHAFWYRANRAPCTAAAPGTTIHAYTSSNPGD